MNITLVTSGQKINSDHVLAIPVFEEEKQNFADNHVIKFLADHSKFGHPYELQLLYSPEGKILLVGAGKKEKFNFETAQNWAGTIVKLLLPNIEETVMKLPKVKGITENELVKALVIGIEIGGYDPAGKYKSEKKEQKLSQVKIQVKKVDKKLSQALVEGEILAEAINLTRNLGDTPANEMTPTAFLSEAKKVAQKNKLKLTVIDETQAKKMGLGGFVGVACGSDEPSYIIILEYQGSKNGPKWGLIGKGITFDSGGISIKPGEGMQEMKYDMLGAASVLASIQALAKMQVRVNVVGVCAVTENLPSGKALKPGDIVKTYSGKTVEILNTDAEGRLILIDAITLAQKDFQATKLIDIATLTGANIVALGDFYVGVFSNDDQFAGDLISVGKKVGEKFWQMPMDEVYDEMIKSDIADIANLGHGSMGSKTAGAITGAKFIEAGVEKSHPWIHLDIAGTSWDMKPKPYRAAGATGVTVKTLVELLKK